MKKILALLLAFAMLFAFAACGENNDDETTTSTTTDLFADLDDDTTAADESTTAAAGDESTTAADESTSAAADESTTAADESTSAAADESTTAATSAATTAPSKGLNSDDIATVVAYYNKAHKATNPAPKGHSTMKLDGEITGDGALGTVLKVASPIIESTLEKNSVETDYIPGRGELKASDVTKAKAVSKNGVTEIVIQLKEQVDGPEADAHTAGSVARGIGTLGNINNALESLGAELYSGRETFTLTYKDAYIKCKVDENTGKITGGTWHYAVHILVVDAEIKLGIKFNAKNLRGIVDYTVAI